MNLLPSANQSAGHSFQRALGSPNAKLLADPRVRHRRMDESACKLLLLTAARIPLRARSQHRRRCKKPESRARMQGPPKGPRLNVHHADFLCASRERTFYEVQKPMQLTPDLVLRRGKSSLSEIDTRAHQWNRPREQNYFIIFFAHLKKIVCGLILKSTVTQNNIVDNNMQQNNKMTTTC